MLQNAKHDELLHCANKFAERVSDLVKNIFEVEFSLHHSQILEQGLKDENRFFVSILFTGSAYGEYILAMNEETAANLIGATLVGKSAGELAKIRVDMHDTFTELLNSAVGESILEIGGTQKKLTMTAPRVYLGTLSYPPIKTAAANLSCGLGQIDCYFYIDRMKLDIALSYADALKSLEAAHIELQAAMGKLKHQQSLLVQTEKMAALGTMAAGVAHEINTPLAITRLVGDQLKLLVNDTEIDTHSVLRLLDTIDVTINRITKITHGLRLFAQSARSGASAQVSIDEVIAHSILLCDKSIKANNVKVHVPPSSDLIFECRVSEIAQAVANVIANACDAVRDLPQKWVKIDVANHGYNIEISVTDAGEGIDSTTAEKMFDPFFTTRDIGSGTGLGLSTAQGILLAHGGSIGLDRRSTNTRFVLILPKTQAATSAA